MSIFDFFRNPDINAGVEEYQDGHIEESLNVPLQKIEAVTKSVSDMNTPIYVYCLSGARSSQATSILRNIGYTNVINIGGISKYRGKVVRR